MGKTLLSICILTTLSVLAMGCLEGTTGPTGPKGPAGPSAQTVTFTLANSDFTAWGTGVWTCDKTVTALTSDIIANGAVLGYYQSGMMVELPWMSDNQLSRKYFHHSAGTVRFVCAEYASSPVLSGAGTWKLVIITGTQSLAKLRTIDTRDYEAVRTAFGLSE